MEILPCVQAKFLSRRFRTEKLLSRFSSGNSEFCQLHPETKTVGDLPHLLVHCPALADRRRLLLEYWSSISTSNPICHELLVNMKTTDDNFIQFVLDCSVLPQVISAAQENGRNIYNILFKATRTYCYSIYRSRLKLLNLWK